MGPSGGSEGPVRRVDFFVEASPVWWTPDTPPGDAGSDEAGVGEAPFGVRPDQVEATLERIKHFRWHGNTDRALGLLDDLIDDLQCLDDPAAAEKALLGRLIEFRGYIHNNAGEIPNYGERHRCGEAISSATAESAVNQVISRRMVKKQQMRWTPAGAHLLLQVRTRVLNEDLATDFHRWYPRPRPSYRARRTGGVDPSHGLPRSPGWVGVRGRVLRGLCPWSRPRTGS